MKTSTFIVACLGGAALPAMAAGGHYAVDDAALVEPGQCQVETWFERESHGARRLLHAGSACRIAAVEVGLNVDRLRLGEGRAGSAFGPQIKWATAVTEPLSVGLAVAANWQGASQGTSPRYLGSMLVVPVSIQASEHWLVHVNLGRDFRAGQADTGRAGLALEWAPVSVGSLIGERFREGSVNHWRLGGRWNLNEALSLDLSHARVLGDKAQAWWTVGLNLAFDR